MSQTTWFDSLASICQPCLGVDREQPNARSLEFWSIITLKITVSHQGSPRKREQPEHKLCDDAELALDSHGGLVWGH